MNNKEILKGLKAGKKLVIDRRDSPTLPFIMDLQTKGLVTTKLIQYDEQSSGLEVVWKK